MNPDFNNWSSFYKKLTLIFNAIVAFSLLPFAFLYLELEKYRRPTYFTGVELLVFEGLCLIVIGVILFWAHTGFKKSLRDQDKEQGLKSKLIFYYRIAIKRYIIYELAAIICLAATYFAQELFFAVVYIFILFILSLARPKYDNVVMHLQLNEEEKQILTKDYDLD